MARRILTFLVVAFLFASPNVSFASATCLHRTIDSTDMVDYKSNLSMSALEFQKAYDQAKKVFKSGKTVDTTALNQLFTPWMFADKAENTSEVLLFNGSNGIIGKAVVLKIIGNKVESVSVHDWGR